MLGVACGGEEDRPNRLGNPSGGSGNGMSTGATGGAAGGSSGGTGGTAGGGAGGSAATGGGGSFRSGSALVAFHFDDAAVYLTEETRVVRTGWDGAELASWTSPRLLVAADYDGETLVAADPSSVSVLNGELVLDREIPLNEPCQRGVVLASQRRAVCGGANSSPPTFYAFSTADGSLLSSVDDAGFYDGPMRRVPGQDLFFTNDPGISPRDYFLYRVESDSRIAYLGESSYHGDFEMTTLAGFWGSPATHLITQEGNLLRLLTADCDAGVDRYSCFGQDGNLGTLPGANARYLAFSDQRDGTLFALVKPADSHSVFREPCAETACTLQRIDVATKQVVASRLVTTPQGRNAFYLASIPDGSGVLMVVSGRSIYESHSADTLPYDVYSLPLTAP